jgi:hypothetical protein
VNGDNSAMNGDNMSSMGGGNDAGAGEGEVYTGHTEREVAFKLLAAHALVDREFYFFLKEDPVAAAASLHIALEDSDYDYIRGVLTENGAGVEWDRVDAHADEIREALHAETVVRSLW